MLQKISNKKKDLKKEKTKLKDNNWEKIFKTDNNNLEDNNYKSTKDIISIFNIEKQKIII